MVTTIVRILTNDRVKTGGIAAIRCGPLQFFVVSSQILSMISTPTLQRFVVTYIFVGSIEACLSNNERWQNPTMNFGNGEMLSYLNGLIVVMTEPYCLEEPQNKF